MTPTVHVLLYGRVLCGQIHGLPKDWGPQHRWVGLHEGWRSEATCATCREAAVEMEIPPWERHEVMLPPGGPGEDEFE